MNSDDFGKPSSYYYNVIADGFKTWGLDISLLEKAAAEVGGIMQPAAPRNNYLTICSDFADELEGRGEGSYPYDMDTDEEMWMKLFDEIEEREKTEREKMNFIDKLRAEI